MEFGSTKVVPKKVPSASILEKRTTGISDAATAVSKAATRASHSSTIKERTVGTSSVVGNNSDTQKVKSTNQVHRSSSIFQTNNTSLYPIANINNTHNNTVSGSNVKISGLSTSYGTSYVHNSDMCTNTYTGMNRCNHAQNSMGSPSSLNNKTVKNVDLPKGWVQIFDQRTKRPYFYHVYECITSQIRPTTHTAKMIRNNSPYNIQDSSPKIKSPNTTNDILLQKLPQNISTPSKTTPHFNSKSAQKSVTPYSPSATLNSTTQKRKGTVITQSIPLPTLNYLPTPTAISDKVKTQPKNSPPKSYKKYQSTKPPPLIKTNKTLMTVEETHEGNKELHSQTTSTSPDSPRNGRRSSGSNPSVFFSPKITVERQEHLETSWENVLQYHQNQCSTLAMEEEEMALTTRWKQMWQELWDHKVSLDHQSSGLKQLKWALCSTSVELQSWSNRQRQNRHNLNKTQLWYLYKIGFVWNLDYLQTNDILHQISSSPDIFCSGEKIAYCVEWAHDFAQLILYIRLHGDAQVQGGETGGKLGLWARKQRHTYHSGLMLKGHINSLCEVGFDFFAPEWNDMYMELLMYKRKNKNCLVPTPHSTSVLRKYAAFLENDEERKLWQRKYYYLGSWVFRQRVDYDLHLNPKSNIPLPTLAHTKVNVTTWNTSIFAESVERYIQSDLTEQKIAMLNDLEFIWSFLPPNWIRGYRDLLVGKESSRFRNAQRHRFRQYHDNKLKSYTPKRVLIQMEQEMLLNQCNFEWSPAPFITFEERIVMVKQFVEENGHAYIPQAHPMLGEWLKNVRKDYDRIKSGKKQSFGLTLERIDILNSIGFVWRVRGKRGLGLTKDKNSPQVEFKKTRKKQKAKSSSQVQVFRNKEENDTAVGSKMIPAFLQVNKNSDFGIRQEHCAISTAKRLLSKEGDNHEVHKIISNAPEANDFENDEIVNITENSTFQGDN